MTYSHQTQKAKLFTDEGQRLLLKVRDRVHVLLSEAGAFRADKAWKINCGSDSWDLLACLDRLEELGEIRMVYRGGATQYQIYIKGGG